MTRLAALVVLLPVVALAEPGASPDVDAPWIDASVGTRLVHRELTFVDDLFHKLSAHTLPIGPMPTVTLDVFPGAAFVKDGIARDLGISASFGELVGVQSAVDGATAPARATSARELEVSAVGRLLLGPATLQLGVGGVLYGFAIDPGKKDTDPLVPGVSLQALRVGLRTRVKVAGPLAMEVSGGYRFLMSTNPFGYDPQFNAYFPHATGGGADGAFGLLVALPAGLELRFVGEWRRWFFSLNPEVGDTYVAGGALDESFAGRVSLAFRN